MRSLVVVLLLCAIYAVSAQKCVRTRLPGAISVPGCVVEEDGETAVYDSLNQTECEKHDECCWDGSGCINTEGGNGKRRGSGKPEENPFSPPEEEGPDGSRTFPGIIPPHFCPPPPKPFPAGCTFSRNEPYVTEPPVDVPYCVRIPCSLDTAVQRELDVDHFKCGSQPGCYFDVPLYQYREAFGPAVLGGVPVCHMAIRNEVFQEQAQKVVDQVGTWNPYYTYCLLQTFDEEITEQPDGCHLIDIMKIFGILPKLAGWDGITSYECTLIDACYRPAEGCFYPVNSNKIVVKSNQRFHFNEFEVVYGRPKCQHFNDENPYELMKSYHRCLSAGCSIDANVANSYYTNLYAIGNQMTPENHREYWAQVLAGKLGSQDMERGIYWDFDKTFGKPVTAPAKKPTDTGPFQPPVGTGPFAPPGAGGFSPPGVGGFSPPIGGPTFPQPSAPVNTLCINGYDAFNENRPCPPKQPPIYIMNNYCPYRPFKVPRFKELKGSFRGCCKVNPCYISRREIRKMHSGPSYYYTEWTEWSQCSATCGSGISKRTRTCVTHDPKLCLEDTEETKRCNALDMCGSWGSWTDYGYCEYVNQFQVRVRACEPAGAVCGPNKQKQQEQTRFCPKRGWVPAA